MGNGHVGHSTLGVEKLPKFRGAPVRENASFDRERRGLPTTAIGQPRVADGINASVDRV
jgi:hypothetical protein